MEVLKLAQYDNNQGLTASDALAEAKRRKLPILTNPEVDERLVKSDQWKSEKEMYPCWTRTHISYKKGATEALVWNEGDKKKTRIPLPLNDGWYKVNNRFGIPNGEKSSDSDPEARHLWRWQTKAFDGLVARLYLFGYGRRVVYCLQDQSRCCGVLLKCCPQAGKRNGVKEEVDFVNQEIEITGRIPDMEAIGAGLATGLAGAIGIAAAITTFKPELDKITDAATCAGDCTFSKLMLTVLGAACFVGGSAGVAWGIYLIGKAIFGINTIRARIEKV